MVEPVGKRDGAVCYADLCVLPDYLSDRYMDCICGSGLHEQDDLGISVLSHFCITSLFLFVHQRPEHIFYHSAQVLDFHERKTADTAIPLPD